MMKPGLKFVLSFALGILLAMPVRAQEIQGAPDAPPPVDILPAAPSQPEMIDESEATHPAVLLTPDKSELVRLDGEAASVIVGNPAHLSVMAENSKTLVLVPRMPGATYFSVLDDKGAVIMQRHVIVGSPKEKYVRIRRSCAGAGQSGCQATQVYYCPDMCHEINVVSPETAQDAQPSADTGAETTTNDNGGAAEAPAQAAPAEESQ